MGKSKMWNISKTADRRANRTEIWDSGYDRYLVCGSVMPNWFSLVWGQSVHFANFPIFSTLFEMLI